MTQTTKQPRAFRLSGEVNDEVKLFTLVVGENTMGSHPASAIFVPAREVSRHHAVIRVDGDSTALNDLESTNGTFVNGVRVRTKVLEEKDWI